MHRAAKPKPTFALGHLWLLLAHGPGSAARAGQGFVSLQVEALLFTSKRLLFYLFFFYTALASPLSFFDKEDEQ